MHHRFLDRDATSLIAARPRPYAWQARSLVAKFFSLLFAAAPLTASTAAAAEDELLVFVSAFAEGRRGAIHAFRLDPAVGKLEPLARNADIESPFYMAISRDDRFLYATHAPGGHGSDATESVVAFELAGRTGQLKRLNHQPSGGDVACYVDVDTTGDTLLVANYGDGSVAALPIAEDGSLGAARVRIQHQGSSVHPKRQRGPHAHSIVISPDNRFALVGDLGLDQVLVYQLEPAEARMTAATEPFARTAAGAGPRHLTFHPNGRHVYVINELDNTITLFDYDPQTATLESQQTIATLPADYEGQTYTADVKVTPDGRFLYGTNRGHDSIACYRIDERGRLELLDIVPSGGAGPQNLAVTPGGELLLCANMPGNRVTLFRIDRDSGSLERLDDSVAMPRPSCILVR
ncbi:MAG: lactonase family protein [Planctomycetota bacterium]|nr:MAG: lactonase family protein [Planctomycetota bacterium]REJ95602.1 MAG: lactonase family protein [Planctomycetota bacterium]REK22620.1 MAG: lactonase family protein [Planctomycetota bacterium]REK48813.1 MAG: lactonase family protein [Planctomycetota bacterium]